MKNFLKEFETFAIRGNAIDLAIGVVVGAAFGQITTSLVNHILTPFAGLFLGGFDFSTLAVPLRGDAVLQYGLFLQAVLNFFLIALALFVVVKFINRLRIREAEEKPKPSDSPEVAVLKEIRDTLKPQR